MRQVAAALLAPLTPGIALILAATIASMSWPFNESDYKLILGAACAVSYLSFFAVGIPVLHILKRYGKLALRHITLAGGIAGVVVFGSFQLVIAGLFGSTAGFKTLTVVWGFTLGECVAISYALISGITNHSTGCP